jgi:hypothetical protein
MCPLSDDGVERRASAPARAQLRGMDSSNNGDMLS